jgi:hypothetical protein
MPDSDGFFRHRPGSCDLGHELGQQVTQDETTVEAVDESRQAEVNVHAVLQRVECAGQHGLEVAQSCVDTLELRHIAQLKQHHDLGP